MQLAKHLDIHITMGKQEDLLFLADIDLSFTTNNEKVKNLIQQSQFNGQIGQDVGLIFHYYVQPGKQDEAIAYFQQAMSLQRDEQQISPVQTPFRYLSQKSKAQITKKDGLIIIKYQYELIKLFEEIEEIQGMESQFDQYDKFSLETTISLKGLISHKNNNRTNVKVDYVDCRFWSDELSPQNFVKYCKALGIIQMCQFDNIPVFHMLGNLKTASFEMKLASFRQIKSYFNKASDEMFKKEEKPFKYVNKGIFRKQVKCFGFFKNKIAVKSDSLYNGQDVFMRLLKVYHKFFQNLL